MLSKVLFFTILLTISAPIIAEDKAFSDWLVQCKEDVFSEVNTKECVMTSHSLSGNYAIAIERGLANILFINILERDSASEINGFQPIYSEVDILLRTDKKTIFTKNPEGVRRRNNDYIQFEVILNIHETDKLFGEMRKGSNLNVKININEKKEIKILEKFSLKGFTKAINYYLYTDKRRFIAEDDREVFLIDHNKDKNIKYGTKEAFGISEKSLNENHDFTKKGIDGNIYGNIFETVIQDGYVKKIYFTDDGKVNEKDMLNIAYSIIPDDSKLVRSFTDNELMTMKRKYLIYNSKKLKDRFKKEEFFGGNPGEFSIIYSLYQGNTIVTPKIVLGVKDK